MIKIIQAFLIFLGVQVLFEGIRRFCGDLSPIYAAALADVVIIVLFVVLKLFHFSTGFFKQKPYTILAFCGVLAVSTITPSTKLQEFMPELPNVAEESLGQFMQSFAGYVVIGLLTPIVEEIVFRGIILKSLLRMKKLQGKHWTAIIISALIFALAHGNPAQMPHALLMGLLLGWLFYRSNSIVPGVVLHFVNNTMAFVVYQFYPNPDAKLAEIFGSETKVYIICVLSVLLLISTLIILNKKFAKPKLEDGCMQTNDNIA